MPFIFNKYRINYFSALIATPIQCEAYEEIGRMAVILQAHTLFRRKALHLGQMWRDYTKYISPF